MISRTYCQFFSFPKDAPSTLSNSANAVAKGMACTILLLSVGFGMASYPMPVLANEFPLAGGSWSHVATGELRHYKANEGSNTPETGVSFTYLGEYYKAWENSAFTAKPYIRIDQHDSERTHIDFRELYWDFASSTWTVAVGFNKVFWGRLEFYNIVDIINQDDLADGPSSKLGQPMINFAWETDEGLLQFYILTGFREATFPGPNGRQILPLPIDTDNTTIEDDSSVYGLDFAIRWTQLVGDNTEISFSHFNGLSRLPDFGFNFDLTAPMLIPAYESIDQTGFEAEWLYEGWSLKFEAISVSGRSDRFSVLAAGMEYTFSGVFGSVHDLTVIAENIQDSREEASPTFFERDFAAGFRWSANDEAGTTALFGANYDPETSEKLIAFEASRRLGENWKAFLSGNIILEKARAPASENLSTAFNVVSQSPLFANSDLSDDFKVFLVDLIISGDVFDLFQNPEPLSNLVFLLEEFSDVNRKLNILENEDYIELRFERYF